MAWWQVIVLIIYGIALSLLSVYVLHRHFLVKLYYKNRKKDPKIMGVFQPLPKVTIQLPVFNEIYVVERLIRTVLDTNYPRELLEIQVLDDSTDGTTVIARRCVEEFKRDGYNIFYLHRTERIGFKAGALAAGLESATGDYVAVFDADFLPPVEFLQKTIPHFMNRKVGMVQVRWGHINPDYSLLTRVQAIFLDGHFVMEQGARSRSGMFFNFNGTAGVWRRRCIDEVGGWQHDTLTEDLDLSYRAQLAGWQFVFLNDVVAQAELPVEMNAWKTQQFRWAKGSIQTSKKLLFRVLKSRLPWRIKGEAAIHLTANFSYFLMALVSFLIFPTLLSRHYLGWYQVLVIDLPIFLAATAIISRFYTCSQKEIYPDWKRNIKYLPFVLALGMGISLNNARAVFEALLGCKTEFQRTPKYKVVNQQDSWWGKRYTVEKTFLSFLEFGVGLYLFWVLLFALQTGIYLSIPFLLIFCFGFLYVGWMSLIQCRWGQLRAWVLGIKVSDVGEKKKPAS